MANKDKEIFIQNEVLNLCIGGAFGRVSVYNKDKSIAEEERGKFHEKIKKELRRLFNGKYKDVRVSSDDHIRNIRNFVNDVSAGYGHILNGKKISFGVGQKLVNLYLKYQWALGDMKYNPPHCPFDAQILKLMSIYEPWSRMSEEQYVQYVKTASKKVGGIDKISQWELSQFNLKNPFYSKNL